MYRSFTNKTVLTLFMARLLFESYFIEKGCFTSLLFIQCIRLWEKKNFILFL